MKPTFASKVSLVTVSRLGSESSVQNQLLCQHQHSGRMGGYSDSETKFRSNVKAHTHTKIVKTMKDTDMAKVTKSKNCLFVAIFCLFD